MGQFSIAGVGQFNIADNTVFEEIYIIKNPKSNSTRDVKRVKNLQIVNDDAEERVWVNFYAPEHAISFKQNLVHEVDCKINEDGTSDLSVCISFITSPPLTNDQKIERALKLLLNSNFFHEGDIIAHGNNARYAPPEGLFTRSNSTFKVYNNEIIKIAKPDQRTYVINLESNDENKRACKVSKSQSYFFNEKNEKVKTDLQKRSFSQGLSRANYE